MLIVRSVSTGNEDGDGTVALVLAVLAGLPSKANVNTHTDTHILVNHPMHIMH